MSLFGEPSWGENTAPVDTTEITTMTLHISTAEVKEFKKLCKEGMKQMYPETYQQANVTDFLLTLLRNNYAGSQA